MARPFERRKPDPNKLFYVTYPCPIHGKHRNEASISEVLAFVHFAMAHYGVPWCNVTDEVSAQLDDIEDCDYVADQFDSPQGETLQELIARMKREHG